jgi:hypothetical protein
VKTAPNASSDHRDVSSTTLFFNHAQMTSIFNNNNNTYKRSASFAGFDDEEREHGARRRCVRHVNTTLKRGRSSNEDELNAHPAKRRQTRRVLFHIRRAGRQGIWAVAEQDEWDALEAAANAVPLVTLSTTETAEPILVTAADLNYSPSEENTPTSFRKAWTFITSNLGIEPARMNWFSVSFRR